eukprot:1159828-Pelagomonas_calceolata.AAC.2
MVSIPAAPVWLHAGCFLSGSSPAGSCSCMHTGQMAMIICFLISSKFTQQAGTQVLHPKGGKQQMRKEANWNASVRSQ